VKIIIIGSGSGKVSDKLFHSSYLIQSKRTNILFDCGDGISKAIISSQIDFNSINYIFISHNHPDHVAGLPDLINQMHIGKRKKELTIITHRGLISSIRKLLDLTYVFPEKLRFNLNFTSFGFNKKYLINDIWFLAIRNRHIENKYNITRMKKSFFVSASLLFSDSFKSVLMTSDIKNNLDLLTFNKYHPDVLVLDSSHINPENLFEADVIKNSNKVFFSHYNFEEISNLQKKINSLNRQMKTDFRLAQEKLQVII